MITRLRELIKDQLLVMNAQKIVVSNNNVKGIFGFFCDTAFTLRQRTQQAFASNVVRLRLSTKTTVVNHRGFTMYHTSRLKKRSIEDLLWNLDVLARGKLSMREGKILPISTPSASLLYL